MTHSHDKLIDAVLGALKKFGKGDAEEVVFEFGGGDRYRGVLDYTADAGPDFLVVEEYEELEDDDGSFNAKEIALIRIDQIKAIRIEK